MLTGKKVIFVVINTHTMNLSIILGSVGPFQIILIVVVLILLFGGKKLPELARGIGQGIKDFKKAKDESDEPTEKK